MTKSEIADIIRESTSLDKKDILFVIDEFLDQILASVDRDERVEIRGFGTFSREIRKARSIFSPIAQKKLDVPERSIVTFRASKKTGKESKGA